MSKKSRSRSDDPVRETQERSKWLFGYRKYTTWTEMSPAEWSRYIRNLPIQRVGAILFLLAIIVIRLMNFFGEGRNHSPLEWVGEGILILVVVTLIWIGLRSFGKK